VRDETIDSRLAPPSQALAEIDKVPDGVEVVRVLASLCASSSTVGEDVAEQDGVADFLVGHEVDQGDIVWSESGGGELLHGESGDTVVEQVELDPFLVQRKIERLEVNCDYCQECVHQADRGDVQSDMVWYTGAVSLGRTSTPPFGIGAGTAATEVRRPARAKRAFAAIILADGCLRKSALPRERKNEGVTELYIGHPAAYLRPASSRPSKGITDIRALVAEDEFRFSPIDDDIRGENRSDLLPEVEVRHGICETEAWVVQLFEIRKLSVVICLPMFAFKVHYAE